VQKGEEQEEKYKEHKTNFEGMYLCDGLVDSTEIWNGMCLTPRDFPQQNGAVSSRHYQVTDA